MGWCSRRSGRHGRCRGPSAARRCRSSECGRRRRRSARSSSRPTTGPRTVRPRPSSASWVPRSTTRPASITRISSTRLEAGQPVGDEDQRAALGGTEQVGGEGVGGRAGRGARPARRARGSGSRPAGPGPPRPAGAGRPTGGPRGVPTSVARPAGQVVEPAGQAHPLEDVAQLVVGGAGVGRSAGSRRWWCRRGRRPGRPGPPRCGRRRRPGGRAGVPSRRDRPRLVGQESEEHGGQGRLAGPARPDDGHPPARREARGRPRGAPAPRHPGSRPRPSGPRGRRGRRGAAPAPRDRRRDRRRR